MLRGRIICSSATALALGLVVAATLMPPPRRAHATAPLRFGLAVHAIDGVPPSFIAERLATSNQLFAGASVQFTQASFTRLDARHHDVTTREDRDALGQYRSADAIDVFVVASLVDVDTPPLARRGVHWRDRTRPGVRYVIVIASSSPWVLPHELSHYFGNRHSDVVGNLMCYERGASDPFLDAAQLGTIRRRATQLARSFRGTR